MTDKEIIERLKQVNVDCSSYSQCKNCKHYDLCDFLENALGITDIASNWSIEE